MILTIIAGCDGSIGVHGRILSAAGEPVAGCAVELGRPGDAVRFQGESDTEGCFQLGGLVAARQRDYYLTVSATGYKPSTGTFRSTGEYMVLVHLAAETAEGESTVELVSSESESPELGQCFAKITGTQPVKSADQ